VARAYGGVVLDGDGNLLLRAPTGGYGGYAWTFAKGRAEPGETPQSAAMREVAEETGVIAEIVAPLPGWFVGDTSDTRMFVMRVVRVTEMRDRETAAVAWVPVSEARQLVGRSRTVVGRKRDAAIISAVEPLLGERKLVLGLAFEGGGVQISASGGEVRLYWRRSNSWLWELLEEDEWPEARAACNRSAGPFRSLHDALSDAGAWWRMHPCDVGSDADEVLRLVDALTRGNLQVQQPPADDDGAQARLESWSRRISRLVRPVH